MTKISRQWLHRLGNTLSICAMLFVISTLYRNFGDIPLSQVTPLSLLVFSTSAALYALCLVFFAAIWWLIVRGESSIRYVDAFTIYAKANIAKFIPGNVFQFVGRYSLAKQTGISTSTIMTSIVLESLIMIATALALSSYRILDPALMKSIGIERYHTFYLFAFLTVIAVGTLTLVSKKLRKTFVEIKKVLSIKTLILCCLINLVIWMIYGFAAGLAFQGVWPDIDTLSVVNFATAYAAAWVLGYMMPGAPGGIGVREAVLYFFFTPYMGSGVAAGLCVVMRILATIGDVIVFAAASILRRT